MDMITITWSIRAGHAVDAPPATGRVRWHLPQVLADSTSFFVAEPITPWVDLVAGAGQITIPDPRTVGPAGWTPVVEVDADVWQARYGVLVPTQADYLDVTTFALQHLQVVEP